MLLLKCPNCGNNLKQFNNTYKCKNLHSFDISKKGYINLLLPSQVHSNESGDDKVMVINRVKFLSLGYYSFLRDKLLEIIIKEIKNKNINLCDLGCGEGYYTQYIHDSLKESYNISTYGIDISKYAINEACTKNNQNGKEITYIIGNLQNIPILDNTINIILNCFSMIDENEFSRILSNDGIFIRVLPDTDHLIGMKEILYDKVRLNTPKDKNLNNFKLINEYHIFDNITLKNKYEISSLFTMTPYYHKSPIDTTNKLLSLETLQTKVSFTILVYIKKQRPF